jgi:predicted transcriptional regulator
MTRDGLKRDGVSANPMIMPDLGTQRAYRVASVPEVLVVSPLGRIQWAHNGAMSDEDKAQLQKVMDGGQGK